MTELRDEATGSDLATFRWPAATWRRVPWWGHVLAVYGGTRVFTTVLLLFVAQGQVANPWTAARPPYLRYVGLMWDSSWYRLIAEQGYPSTLPLGADGSVAQNAWAFFPLYPFLVRGLMVITQAPWYIVAPITSVLLGAAAMLVIHRLVTTGAPRAVERFPQLPLVTVLLVAVFPSSVVLQVGYTESLALLLIVSCLAALVARRYGLAAVLVVLLGFTRAVALPISVVVVVHLLARWRSAARGEETFVRRDKVGLAGLAVAAVVSGFAWPTICGWVTGVPDGYLQTQGAWRADKDVVPFAPWGSVARFWFGAWAPAVLVGAVAVVLVLVLSRSARRWGPELQAWAPAYLGYLVAVIEPGTSVFRFLLLAFPLGGVAAGMAPARWRRPWVALLVVVLAGLQARWAFELWAFTPPSDWPP